MKKFLSVILSVLMLAVAGCGQIAAGASSGGEETPVTLNRPEHTSVYGVEAPDSRDRQALGGAHTAVLSSSVNGEVRGVWISYLTLEPMIKGKTQAQFVKNIGDAFDQAADFGFNTVFVHARPFGDALYKSEYFPWSRYLTGEEGRDPGYDPLELMVSLAHERGLRIEAWINPYRVRLDDKPMSADNQAKKWLASGNDGALAWNGGVYYNPGSAAARELIVNGVREIVENYDVDGIHFDDYFYPTTDLTFDAATYQASGSSLTQADWRRENVNKLVHDVYAAVKEANPDCLFGISPQGNVDINYNGQFADVRTWVSEPGYVDYICPQIYYGYRNGTAPYAETVALWDSMIKVDTIKLYVGIAAYKVGTVDTWAGEGKNEWIDTTDILARMVKTARKAEHYGGIVIYSYESLFGDVSEQMKIERNNLKKVF